MKRLLQKYSKVIWCLRNFIPMLLFPVVNFYLFEFYISNPWENMKVPIQFLNIYLFELLMLLFLFLFGRLKWSLRLQSIFFMVVGLANCCSNYFRGHSQSAFKSRRQMEKANDWRPHCRRFDFYRTIVQFYADAASRKHNP